MDNATSRCPILGLMVPAHEVGLKNLLLPVVDWVITIALACVVEIFHPSDHLLVAEEHENGHSLLVAGDH